ncbi:hypothetical protein [Streptomyces sp. NPDC000133]
MSDQYDYSGEPEHDPDVADGIHDSEYIGSADEPDEPDAYDDYLDSEQYD